MKLPTWLARLLGRRPDDLPPREGHRRPRLTRTTVRLFRPDPEPPEDRGLEASLELDLIRGRRAGYPRTPKP